jgi:hypothetical protein
VKEYELKSHIENCPSRSADMEILLQVHVPEKDVLAQGKEDKEEDEEDGLEDWDADILREGGGGYDPTQKYLETGMARQLPGSTKNERKRQEETQIVLYHSSN